MDRNDLGELHYIMHTSNIKSILRYGILSHEDAEQYNHVSIAMEEIQSRRSVRAVPNALPIHQYVCLYLHARNATLRKILDRHEELAVLRINTDVLDSQGAVISDGNASSDYTRYYPSPDGLRNLDRDLVLARYWTSDDPYEQMIKKRKRCAELLVPSPVGPELIIGAYVSCPRAEIDLREGGFPLPVTIDHDFFFGMGA